MLRTPRRALPALAAATVLALAGCDGAGYGEPIAATDGDDATVAIAPAPVTTASETPGTTTDDRDATSTGADRSSSAQGDGDDGGSADGDGGGEERSSGGGQGDDGLAAYASDANRFCAGFEGSTRTLTTDIGAAGTDTAAVGQAIIRYGSAIEEAASGLRAATVPSAARSFHQDTLRWVSGVTGAIDASRSGLASGSESAGATVVRKVQALGQPPMGTAVPAALRARATACAS